MGVDMHFRVHVWVGGFFCVAGPQVYAVMMQHFAKLHNHVQATTFMFFILSQIGEDSIEMIRGKK